MKRYIRLKERKPTNFIHTPPNEYLKIRPKFIKNNFYEHTNSDYFLTNEISSNSDNSIFVLGGSFIENIYCSADKRICSILNKKLMQNNYDVNIINAGVSGSTSLNIVNVILNKIISFSPKAIIAFIPTNDGYCMSLENGLWNTNSRYSNLLGINHSNIFSDTNFEKKLNDICSIYSILKSICDQFQIDLTVATSPLIDKNVENILTTNLEFHKELSSHRNIVFDRVLDHCKKLEIDTIDLRPMFSNKYDLFFDDVHTNDQGSEKIGEYLYQKLNSKFEIYKKDYTILNTYEIFQKILLKKDTIWSSSIETLSTSTRRATISFIVNCDENIKNNNALFCVDFDGQSFNTKQTSLTVSTIVGSYKYIQTKENSKYSISYSFLIPANVEKIRIGFRLWRSLGEITIENAKLYIQNTKKTETLSSIH